jgi:hypothetical protein
VDHPALRRAQRPHLRLTIGQFHGYLQPAAHMRRHPPVVGVLSQRAHQQRMIDGVEGSSNTLPAPRTFRRSCAFSARCTRSRDESFASTAAASAVGNRTCCWSCPTSRAR